MFGTFAAEKDDEPVVYGLVSPIKTYNPITIQCKYFTDLIKFWFSDAKFSEKIQRTCKGPGWSIKKQKYLAVPEVKKEEKPWNMQNDTIVNLYVYYQVKMLNIRVGFGMGFFILG